MTESKEKTYIGRLGLLSRVPSSRTQFLFWSIVLGGITSDLVSKWAIFKYLETHGTVSVIDDVLRLVMVQNAGAAFGIASGMRFWLTGVSFVALIIILTAFYFGSLRHCLLQICLALFTAGICGNLYDRIFNDGLVRDFIDVVYWPGRHWPAFNIADSLLCIAVGLMVISTFLTDKPGQKHVQ